MDELCLWTSALWRKNSAVYTSWSLKSENNYSIFHYFVLLRTMKSAAMERVVMVISYMLLGNMEHVNVTD